MRNTVGSRTGYFNIFSLGDKLHGCWRRISGDEIRDSPGEIDKSIAARRCSKRFCNLLTYLADDEAETSGDDRR
jgi:hypothetical protein